MKRLSVLIFALGVLEASAEGFFVPANPVQLEPGMELEEPAGPAIAKAATCALQARWDLARPTGVELTWLGSPPSCNGPAEPAIQAAVAAAPPAAAAPPGPAKAAEMPGRDGIPPVYQCGVTVTYDPAVPAQAASQLTGAGCSGTQGTALRAARQLVLCFLHAGVRCQL